MCLLIAMAIAMAGFNFYNHDYFLQAYVSWGVAILVVVFFTYKMVKNRECIFGDKSDCNREANEKLRGKK